MSATSRGGDNRQATPSPPSLTALGGSGTMRRGVSFRYNYIPMSARRLHNSWWIDFHFNRVRYRKRSPLNTRQGALDFEATVRQQLSRGEPVLLALSSGRTFANFAEEWFETYVRTNNRPSEQRAKRMKLDNHLLPYFGSRPIATIGEQDVERFKKAKLEQGLSAKSVNNALTVLRKCLQTAHEWGALPRVPRFQWLRVAPQRFDFLTKEEAGRLLEASRPDGVWGEMVLCGLRTGMRVGELLALAWQDVDFERHTLTVQRAILCGIVDAPKNNRTRTIPLTTDLEACLVRRRSEGIVFPNDFGRHHTYSAAVCALHRAQQRAGLRGFGWHALRHTFASQLVTAGVSLRAVQELLGHSTIQMTMRYSHLAPSALRDAVAVLVDPETPSVSRSGATAT